MEIVATSVGIHIQDFPSEIQAWYELGLKRLGIDLFQTHSAIGYDTSLIADIAGNIHSPVFQVAGKPFMVRARKVSKDWLYKGGRHQSPKKNQESVPIMSVSEFRIFGNFIKQGGNSALKRLC